MNVTQQFVYRVEDIERQGPYFRKGLNLNLDYERSLHPEPCAEGLEIEAGVDVCGFGSYEQLSSWFYRKLRHDLLVTGVEYFVAQYAVPSDGIRVGEAQVIFSKDSAEFVRRVPLADWSHSFLGEPVAFFQETFLTCADSGVRVAETI